jgi:arginyl-tRNA synthetase
MREKIEQAVNKALAEMGAGEARFTVSRPAHLEHGDFSTNAALVAKVDPHELAQKLSIEGVERVEVAGKFVNFFLSRGALVPQPQQIPQLYAGETVLVEYTDPNPFKEFHIGHLMSNAIGESVARLLEAAGANVARANYQGDVGPHVAKALWGKLQKPDVSWGEAYVHGAQAYEEGKKEEIDILNKKVYDKSDPEVNALYEQGRKESLEHFEAIYKKLGTKFDHYFFESETAPRGLALIQKHKNLFEESDGAVVFRGKHTRVFITGAGLPTYEAKELGLAELKQEKVPAERYITVTAGEQSGFFEVVFEAIGKIFPNLNEKLVHLAHGHMRFASGKMSSRKGNIVTGESLLEDLEEAAREKMGGRELKDAAQVAQFVAVGAVKYAVLKQGSNKDIIFDPEKSLSLEGDSGPYLQYAHARARSLVNAAVQAGIQPGLEDMPAEANMLERTLIHYADVVERAAREMEPHHVTTYLTEVAGAFNSWYASARLIGGASPRYGMWLTYATIKTLHDGLEVLGIPAPEEM